MTAIYKQGEVRTMASDFLVRDSWTGVIDVPEVGTADPVVVLALFSPARRVHQSEHATVDAAMQRADEEALSLGWIERAAPTPAFFVRP